MQSDFSYFIVGKKKYIYVTYQDVSALQKNEELSNALHYSQKRDEELTKALKALGNGIYQYIFSSSGRSESRMVKNPGG